MSTIYTNDVLHRTHSPEQAIGPGNYPAVRPNEIALMFSGGLDSTATAIALAEKYDRVHLVTYKNGYGHFYHHRTAKRVEELNKAMGDKFVYTLISTKDYFDEILVKSVIQDYRKYKSGFIWFMGCKMAMHMRSAMYCLENGLRYMTDGSNEDTNEMVEQMLISLTMIQFFYDSFGIHFGTPVYEHSREESRELIKKWGLKMGIQVMDRHLCIQPTCIAGELYYMPYLLFNKRVKHDEDTVAQFIDEKSAIANRIMSEYFEQKGLSLEALVADRMQQITTMDAVNESSSQRAVR